jgi:hypothetical protein
MTSLNNRKPDRYQARARELAPAAGVDPDSRIKWPGQRSMPAWCAYQDAARAEHVATEIETVAAELPPQIVAPVLQQRGALFDVVVSSVGQAHGIHGLTGLALLPVAQAQLCDPFRSSGGLGPGCEA